MSQTPSLTRNFFVAAVAIVPAQLSFATYDFTVLALQRDLGLSIDQINAVQLMPTAAALVIVFVAGRLAQAFGSRRLIAAAAALFCLGTLLSALSTGLPTLLLGRAMEGAAGTTMSIASLALLERSFSQHPRRGLMYGLYAAVAPAVFIIAPLLGADLATQWSWRALPALSCGFGALALATSLACVPAEPPSVLPMRTLSIPLLAGVVTALIGASAMMLGVGAPLQAALAALGTAAGIVFLTRTHMARFRLMIATGLSHLAAAWRGLIAFFLMRTIDLLFFATLLLQYRFDVGLSETAWLMLPCQAASTAGCLLGGTAMAYWGAHRTAVGCLLATAAAALATMPLGVGAPPWQFIASASLMGAANMAALAALTAHVMAKPARGAEGTMASVLNLSENAGIVLGGLVAGLVVFGTLESRLGFYLDQFTPVSLETARAVAARVREGASLHVLGSHFDVPVDAQLPASVEAARDFAWIDAYRAALFLCLATNTAAAAVLWRCGSLQAAKSPALSEPGTS
ncbi:MFS transporter [Ancylobacter sp.]|uniref:MFS transporter n=1 Tax=Ancylobacter sp. TaxID=1872567 RepID=UPI003D104BC5